MKKTEKMRAEGAQGDDSVGGLHFKKGKQTLGNVK